MFTNFIYRYHARCIHKSCHLLKKIHKKKEFRRWHRYVIKKKLVEKAFDVEEAESDLLEWNFMVEELFKYFGGEINRSTIRSYITSPCKTENLQDIANKIYEEIYVWESEENEEEEREEEGEEEEGEEGEEGEREEEEDDDEDKEEEEKEEGKENRISTRYSDDEWGNLSNVDWNGLDYSEKLALQLQLEEIEKVKPLEPLDPTSPSPIFSDFDDLEWEIM